MIPNKAPLFVAKEKSTWICRNCTHADCREFQMLVGEFNGQINSDGTPAVNETMLFDRPYKCTFFCCNRPSMDVHDLNYGGGRRKLGRVHNPWFCCQLGNDVYNFSDQLAFKVRGACCQLGVLCKQCPYKPCQEVHFNVLDSTDKKIAPLKKKSPGCCKAFFQTVDNMAVFYPSDMSLENRALLMANAILLDYCYFEETQQEKMNR